MPEESKLEDLERAKAALITRYLEIQEILDGYNEQMYKVCCEIETLNLRIAQCRNVPRAVTPATPPRPGKA